MKKGFTLIELLVVVLIIGILSAIALPQYQTAVDKARYSTMMAAVRALKDAQELYYLANGSYATDLHDLEGVLPGGFVIDSSNVRADKTGDFHLIIQGGNVYGGLNVKPRNAFMMYYDRTQPNGRRCYAYKNYGERGRKLCKSLGGIRSGSSDNASCNGSCTIYALP